MSRQPVSHALHLLKSQGLVRESGRKGFEVAPVDPTRLRQLYEVRGALDGLAARLAENGLRTARTFDLDHVAKLWDETLRRFVPAASSTGVQ